MPYSLVWLAGCFSSGIWLEDIARIDFNALYLLAVLSFSLSVLFLRRRLGFYICLGCLVFFLGAAVLANSRGIPKDHIVRAMIYQGDKDCRLRGFICSQPELKRGETNFVLRVKEAQFGRLKRQCRGKVLVRVSGGADLRFSDELLLQGHLYRPYARGRGRSSYRDYLSRQGIYCLMRIAVPALAVKSGREKGPGIAFKGFAFRMKAKMEGIIFKYLPTPSAGILDAMLLGERKAIPPLVNQAMMKSGTVHILVVSGFNTGMVILIVSACLKLMRLPRKSRPFLALPVLILYALMTGASTPVVRATVMATVFMFAYYFRRDAQIYNSCAAALIFILAAAPEQLFDIGAQLSFASVLSIVWLYPKLKMFFRADRAKTGWIGFLLDGCLVSLSAWLGTMGLVGYYFKIFVPVTVLANIFIVPLAAFITLCGFSLIFIAVVFPTAAPFFSVTAETAVLLLLKLNALLLKLPGAYFYL
ncbi:MAG: ComEC/Rec2 family competence protein [Candidatus Omnitrophota bacterium]|nr:ComEC/Rec2 family competence protein [Candidatus Omnitrophota bacterium]